MAKYTSLSKREIAESQLRTATNFYLAGQEYPSALTLAGASEEILGKILVKRNELPILELNYEDFCEQYVAMWGDEPPTKKNYVSLKNEPRNQMKHLMSAEEFSIDYEFQTGIMIMRAFKNYKLCYGTDFELSREFKKKRVKNWRARNAKSL